MVVRTEGRDVEGTSKPTARETLVSALCDELRKGNCLLKPAVITDVVMVLPKEGREKTGNVSGGATLHYGRHFRGNFEFNYSEDEAKPASVLSFLVRVSPEVTDSQVLDLVAKGLQAKLLAELQPEKENGIQPKLGFTQPHPSDFIKNVKVVTFDLL